MLEEPEDNKEAVDLEDFAKSGHKVPKDCDLFRIRIDNEKYVVQQAALTGRELLKLADKDPECYRILFKKCNGKAIEIDLDEHFSFLDPGVERFMTQKRKAQDGCC